MTGRYLSRKLDWEGQPRVYYSSSKVWEKKDQLAQDVIQNWLVWVSCKQGSVICASYFILFYFGFSRLWQSSKTVAFLNFTTTWFISRMSQMYIRMWFYFVHDLSKLFSLALLFCIVPVGSEIYITLWKASTLGWSPKRCFWFSVNRSIRWTEPIENFTMWFTILYWFNSSGSGDSLFSERRGHRSR